MPSQTIYVTAETFRYAKRTSQEGQTVGKRLQELVEKGKESEQNEV